MSSSWATQVTLQKYPTRLQFPLQSTQPFMFPLNSLLYYHLLLNKNCYQDRLNFYNYVRISNLTRTLYSLLMIFSYGHCMFPHLDYKYVNTQIVLFDCNKDSLCNIKEIERIGIGIRIGRLLRKQRQNFSGCQIHSMITGNDNQNKIISHHAEIFVV